MGPTLGAEFLGIVGDLSNYADAGRLASHLAGVRRLLCGVVADIGGGGQVLFPPSPGSVARARLPKPRTGVGAGQGVQAVGHASSPAYAVGL
jgi:hypothetical protein